MGRRLSLIAGGAAATLYLSTLSRWYSADSLWFALAIDSPDPGARIDAYHLLLHPLSWLWVELWRGLGWTGHSIHALQALNALAGGVCVGLITAIAAHASGSWPAAMLVAAGATVSGGLWLLSTEAEDVTLGLAAQLAVARSLIMLAPGGHAGAQASWRLGAMIGGATLAYASNALLLGVAALAHWQGRMSRPAWRHALLWVGAGFACLAAPVAYVVLDFDAGPAQQVQRLSRFLGGSTYGQLSPAAFPRGAYAFLRMFVLFPGLGINDRTSDFLRVADQIERTAFVAVYLLAVIGAAAPVVLLWRQRHQAPLVLHRLALWAGLFALFALWWVPSDLEFWVPVASVWWIALAIVAAQSSIFRFLIGVLALCLLAANGLGLILPHRDAMRNQPLQIALRLARELTAEDRVIAAGNVHTFMRYFTGRDSVRVDERGELEAAVFAIRTQPAPAEARLVIAGFELDASERIRWQARPVFEDLGRRVWELGSPIEAE